MPDRGLSTRCVGDGGVLVEFDDLADPMDRIQALDRALNGAGERGLIDIVPALTTMLIRFDPDLLDAAAVEALVRVAANAHDPEPAPHAEHVVMTTYGGARGPDLPAVAEQAGLTARRVVELHAGARYRVGMYGFAPGYAYLVGVPDALRLPRKPAAERGHAVGSVMIAAGQCLITTLPMPTGWWVIGHTELTILDPKGEEPLRFAPGDHVRFAPCGG